MRFVLVLSIISTLLSSAEALSIDLESRLDTGGPLEARAVDWPRTAGGFKAKRGGAPTNGELLKRGLPPNARPRKLYIRSANLQARIDNPAPATASQAPGQTYNFDGCYARGGAVSSVSTANTKIYRDLTFTSDADGANQCAGRQDVDGPGGTFLITNDSGIGTCITSIRRDVGTPQICSATAYARYTGS